MPFAPVLTKGLFDIEVEAGERVIELLKSRKLIEERDDGIFLRKIPGWRTKLNELLDGGDIDLTVRVGSGRIVYSFVDRKELEKMKERLDREIQGFKSAYELYKKYQEELRREGRSMLIDVDGDCEVWE